ncbi:hypothetical protein EHW97_14820 [Aeromicrobium camelliae]|uniref:Uncharacterized protein n=2 Tax=Aeromicrobium TaxID=2040 RepID=A0A3N6WJR7_9ACTN|nr:DUF6349 family protein [Aeromicrobium camelliae]RQN02025.1 hypothetical protein EHW97_14820 [Aeromicrobium camelliae]
MEQYAIDLDALIREEALARAGQWTGAPLTYTTDYYAPELLDAAFERYQLENGQLGSLRTSHMWAPAIAVTVTAAAGHTAHIYTADCRCDEPDHDHGPDFPDDLMYQAICPPCSWHHIAANENAAVEAWHDHALPGWRNLPVVPRRVAQLDDTRATRQRRDRWVAEHYPEHWQRPGYPILTERGKWGTRHVSGRSPFGGYDLTGSVGE